jgi:signal peptidase I
MCSHPGRTEKHALKCELAGEVLHSFGSLRLQVTGWSMLPAVWPGDTLELEWADRHELSTGDIVLFGRDRRLFAHRIVKNSERILQTRGDALAYIDPVVAENELLGRVTCIVRAGKRIRPSKRLSVTQRAVAGIVRSSDLAARVIVGMHGLLHNNASQS